MLNDDEQKNKRRRNERGSWVVVVKEQVDNKCAMEANDGESRSGWRNGRRRRKMGETRGLSNRGRLARDRFESLHPLPPGCYGLIKGYSVVSQGNP